ncbi:hypothetical protein MRB53_012664 [Persea americana]|uniref:Uncharacterized protein n=1 Tax=Persea americana TaxID=3435 RepID=A0ACC2LY34_PERAE|nr:hypothetical protein MRB53_012664 [Persea americana]
MEFHGASSSWRWLGMRGRRRKGKEVWESGIGLVSLSALFICRAAGSWSWLQSQRDKETDTIRPHKELQHVKAEILRCKLEIRSDFTPASDDLSASAGSYISFICAPEQPVISSCKGRSVTPNSCREKRSLLHLSISFPGSPHTLKFHWWLVEIFLLIEVNMKNGLRIHQGTWVHCPCRFQFAGGTCGWRLLSTKAQIQPCCQMRVEGDGTNRSFEGCCLLTSTPPPMFIPFLSSMRFLASVLEVDASPSLLTTIHVATYRIETIASGG